MRSLLKSDSICSRMSFSLASLISAFQLRSSPVLRPARRGSSVPNCTEFSFFCGPSRSYNIGLGFFLGEEEMGSVVPGSVQKLVAREIRRCVSEAVIRDIPCLRVSACAAEILKKYPHCGIDHTALADQIMMAAVKAGVAV